MSDLTNKLLGQTERGQQAKELLENPMLKDAFDKIEKYLREDWETTKGPDGDRREDIWRTLKLLENIKGQIKSIAATGKAASNKLLDIK